MREEILQLRITAGHLMENLAGSLYEDPGHCLWEIVRNGVVACMPEETWKPTIGDVDITIVDNHPLAPKGRALVVLDRGSGFTEPAIERFCSVGAPIRDEKRSRGTHSGAAQKCIGRFAAFALNKACFEGDPQNGFYIFTRTASRGAITSIKMIPAEIERDGGPRKSSIDPDDTMLGPQKNIKGSFTAIVIPNPVFKNHEEVRMSLAWRIPRKQNQMFKLIIGGKKLMPPPLASRISKETLQGDVEVFIDRIDEQTTKTRGRGIWLCDGTTGLPITCATTLHGQIPHPFWHMDLTGDIFIPGLLENQDTARSKLRRSFFHSAVWRRAMAYLVSQVAEDARALLGEEDVFGKDPFDRHITEFVEMCNQLWGVPKLKSDDDFAVKSPHKRSSGGGSGHGGSGGGSGNHRTRATPIRIGDKDFTISKRQLDGLILAEVDATNGTVIYVNVHGYESMPTSASARAEHILLKIVEAVGRYLFPSDSRAVTSFVGSIRREFLQRKK